MAGIEQAQVSEKEHRPWFQVPGVQRGDRTVEEQLQGLEAVDVAGASILDLGCAEGLISKALIERGAGSADCVGIRYEELSAGQRFCEGLPIRFHYCDLREPETYNTLDLQSGYDVVLLLSIVHKMRKPMSLIQWAAAKASSCVLVRVPAQIYRDRAKSPVEHDIVAQMGSCGWTLAETPKTCRGEWLGVFRRA